MCRDGNLLSLVDHFVFTVIRYSIDVNVDKTVVNKDIFSEPSKKRKAMREVKSKFEER